MPLGHRNQPVQALPSDRTDHALTDCIRLRASYRGAQYLHANALIESSRCFYEDPVSVMNQVPMVAIVPYQLS
jgi:hypothetical protein